MPPVMFTGQVSQNFTLVSNITITTSKPVTLNISNNYITKSINWNNNIPPYLSTLSIADVLKNQSLYNTKLVFETTIVGSLDVTATCTIPLETVNTIFIYTIPFGTYNWPNKTPNSYIVTGSRHDPSCMNMTFYYQYQPPPQGIGPITTTEYDVPGGINLTNFPKQLNLSLQLSNAQNNKSSVTITSFIFTTNVTIGLDCSGKNLESTFCNEYCTINAFSCERAYIDYCFNSSNNIGTNKYCQDYISSFIKNFGPNPTLDLYLKNYCNVFTSIPDFESKTLGTPTYNICACHLRPDLYQTLYNQITGQIPGLAQISGLNQYCIYPACDASIYKSVHTGAVCAVPNCLNSVTFNENGTISKITVNQNSVCSTGSDNSWIIGLIFGFAFIILILFYILTR